MAKKQRRGRGEGSISQRKDGLWHARIDLGFDASGKRIRKSVYAKTRKQVHEELQVLMEEQRNGGVSTPSKIAVAELLNSWLDNPGKPLAKREGGNQLLSAIAKRKAQAVVMLKLDRMFRNAGDCLSTVEAWEKAGVALHVIDLGGNAIDTTSAAGRFMLVVLATFGSTARNFLASRASWIKSITRAAGKAPLA